jgi:hypothetical protein
MCSIMSHCSALLTLRELSRRTSPPDRIGPKYTSRPDRMKLPALYECSFTFDPVAGRVSAYTFRLTNSGVRGMFCNAGRPALQDKFDHAKPTKAKLADPYHAAKGSKQGAATGGRGTCRSNT